MQPGVVNKVTCTKLFYNAICTKCLLLNFYESFSMFNNYIYSLMYLRNMHIKKGYKNIFIVICTAKKK